MRFELMAIAQVATSSVKRHEMLLLLHARRRAPTSSRPSTKDMRTQRSLMPVLCSGTNNEASRFEGKQARGGVKTRIQTPAFTRLEHPLAHVAGSASGRTAASLEHLFHGSFTCLAMERQKQNCAPAAKIHADSTGATGIRHLQAMTSDNRRSGCRTRYE
ncbi:hypothetical protein BKA80DRAFT_260018 [Phyllosticta citrichinensis]